MKKELIVELFNKFEQACYLFNDIECWSARDLQVILGYTEWRNFLKVLDKARQACENTGIAIADHFVDVNKMVLLGIGTERVTKDCDELWSARKVVHRTLWHERDHTQQIAQVLAGL